MPYWLIDKKSIYTLNIIDFGVTKNIVKTYFSIKTSLELFPDYFFIIINVNNKMVR